MTNSRYCCAAANDVMTTKSKIVFKQIVSLLGPNSWTYRPVLEAWVDFAAIQDSPQAYKAAALIRLLAWVPELAQSHLNPEASRGTQSTLAVGRWSPQILEHLTLTLQSLADMPGGFGDTHQTSESTLYKVVVRAWHPSVTTYALQAARNLLEAAFNDTQVDLKATIAHLQELRHTHCLGPSTACIVDAADDRDIPAIRLNTGNLLQLGYGINQRRIWTAETDRTGAIAETISRDKYPCPLVRLLTRPQRLGRLRKIWAYRLSSNRATAIMGVGFLLTSVRSKKSNKPTALPFKKARVCWLNALFLDKSIAYLWWVAS
jgi:hypothetical protein